MTLTEADVITATQAYTYLSVQTQAEANAATNTTANLLYTSQSRSQGNFSLFYALAVERVAADATRYGLTLTDLQKSRAYAYLIQHYFEAKFKDWQAAKYSSGGDSVDRGKFAGQTSGMSAYTTLLNSYVASAVTATEIALEKHTDSDNYPDEWSDSQMSITEIDLEDPT